MYSTIDISNNFYILYLSILKHHTMLHELKNDKNISDENLYCVLYYFYKAIFYYYIKNKVSKNRLKVFILRYKSYNVPIALQFC